MLCFHCLSSQTVRLPTSCLYFACATVWLESQSLTQHSDLIGWVASCGWNWTAVRLLATLGWRLQVNKGDCVPPRNPYWLEPWNCEISYLGGHYPLGFLAWCLSLPFYPLFWWRRLCMKWTHPDWKRDEKVSDRNDCCGMITNQQQCNVNL